MPKALVISILQPFLAYFKINADCPTRHKRKSINTQKLGRLIIIRCLTDNRRLGLEPILFHENDHIPALPVCPQSFNP
jgi:hypothetical protein